MTTNPHTLSESARIRWNATHNEGQRCKLGPYTFWVNPTELRRLLEAQYAVVPTVDGGFVFNDFGTKPYEVTVTGDTGTMGEYDVDDRKKGLAATAPRFNTPNRMTTFSVPGRGTWPCRVISIEESASSEDPFCWHYTLSLLVFPDSKPGYVKIASLASMANGITGPFGQKTTTTTNGGLLVG